LVAFKNTYANQQRWPQMRLSPFTDPSCKRCRATKVLFAEKGRCLFCQALCMHSG
jgi:hypothetical protein